MLTAPSPLRGFNTNTNMTSTISNIKVLIFGHPGSGTHYVSKLLEAYKIRVGHESMLPNGICSWSHVHCVPVGHELDLYAYSIPRRPDDKFDITIHLVRNPWNSIGNIIKENEDDISYKFRRTIIKYHFSVDLDDYSVIDRAALSYIYWNQLAEMQKPDYRVFVRVKVEEAQDEFPVILQYVKNPNYHVSQTIGTKSNKVTEFDEMSPRIYQMLQELAEKYGY